MQAATVKQIAVVLSMVNFIFYSLNFFVLLYYFSDWVALVFPRLGLSFDAVSLSTLSERKKPSKEKEKEDGKANYRRARPFAFDEVDYFIHECSIKKRIVPMKIIRFITEKAK